MENYTCVLQLKAAFLVKSQLLKYYFNYICIKHYYNG